MLKTRGVKGCREFKTGGVRKVGVPCELRDALVGAVVGENLKGLMLIDSECGVPPAPPNR